MCLFVIGLLLFGCFMIVWVLFVCYCSAVVDMIPGVALVCVFGLLVCGCMLLVFVIGLRVLYWCWFGFGIA